MDLQVGLLPGFREGAEEGVSVVVIEESRLPAIAPILLAVDRRGEFNSHRSRPKDLTNDNHQIAISKGSY